MFTNPEVSYEVGLLFSNVLNPNVSNIHSQLHVNIGQELYFMRFHSVQFGPSLNFSSKIC